MYHQWNEEDTLSWDNVLNTLSNLGPAFACNAEDIEILSSPTQFYESLLEHASNANDRIFISTLYIGQGERERNLVDAISRNLNRNDNVKVNMLMDHSRSQRNMDKKQSSLHTLLPLFNTKHDDQFNLHLFRSPNLHGLWSWFPERSREVAGVHHMKAFIFDDTLIVSGANLNETYLNNRQDRYFVFRNNPELTDHVYGMMDMLSNNCPNVRYNAVDDTFCISTDIHHVSLSLDAATGTAAMDSGVSMNVENEPQKWFDFICDLIRPYTAPDGACKLRQSSLHPNSVENEIANEIEVNLNEYGTDRIHRIKSDGKQSEDTYIVMGTQMMDKIHSDSAITSCILSMPRNVMKIGTAYFNLAEKYKEILLNTYCGMVSQQQGSLEVLTASEQCNSFYKARGMAGYVTPLYELFARQFEEAVTNIYDAANVEDKRFVFHRYNREKWTYHGKGIWMDLEEEKEDPFSLTLIGSSNYGERSVGRDTELNFTVVTKNESLRSRLGEEWKNLTRFTFRSDGKDNGDGNESAKDHVNDEQESVGFMTNMLSGLARRFM